VALLVLGPLRQLKGLAHDLAQTDNQVKRDMQEALMSIEASGMTELESSRDPRTGWQLIGVVNQFRKPLEDELDGVAIGPLFIFFLPETADPS
jgi:hypothetical protein